MQGFRLARHKSKFAVLNRRYKESQLTKNQNDEKPSKKTYNSCLHVAETIANSFCSNTVKPRKQEHVFLKDRLARFL